MKAKARAVARTVAKHRVFFLFVVGLFTIGLIAGTYAISATDGPFAGQMAPGDHNWYSMTEMKNQACENCHQDVAGDMTVGAHGKATNTWTCSSCHTPGTADHVAKTARCVDCHSEEATEISADAHSGILASLGESSSTASKTCQSCHTHVAVVITATIQDPLPLKMVAPTVP